MSAWSLQSLGIRVIPPLGSFGIGFAVGDGAGSLRSSEQLFPEAGVVSMGLNYHRSEFFCSGPRPRSQTSTKSLGFASFALSIGKEPKTRLSITSLSLPTTEGGSIPKAGKAGAGPGGQGDSSRKRLRTCAH